MTPEKGFRGTVSPGLSPAEKRLAADWLDEQRLEGMRRRDTRENVVSYFDGVQRHSGAPTSVADVQEAAGFPQRRGKGPLHTLIGAGEWGDEVAERQAQRLRQKRPVAIAVDCCEVRASGTAHDVFSVHAVLPGGMVPVDFGRVRSETDDIEASCLRRVLSLLDGCAELIEGEGGVQGRIPVLASQRSLAENSHLRPACVARGLEYGLAVTEDYYARIALDPASSRFSAGTYAEVAFATSNLRIDGGGGSAIPILEISSPGGRPLPEHLVRTGGPVPAYFICRGRPSKRARISSYNEALRSIEVAKQAAQLPGECALAEYLGIKSFFHPNDDSWRRHMLLRALFERFRLEVLDP